MRKLENLRKALELIGDRAAYALQYKAGNEAKQEEFFSEVLKGIQATSELAIKGIEVA